MSTTSTFIPKTHHQNATVKVEAVQMTNDNVSEIVKWIGKPNIQVHNTKIQLKDINIITIEIPGYAGTQHLRYKDFLIKYTNDNEVSYLVLSEKQFHQRFESSSLTETKNYNHIIWNG